MQGERIDWPNGTKIALSIVVNVEEGSEMTIARSASTSSRRFVITATRVIISTASRPAHRVSSRCSTSTTSARAGRSRR